MLFEVIQHPHLDSHIGIASIWPVFNCRQAKNIKWVHIPLIWKKMMHVKSCHFLSMSGSSSDCTLDHDRPVDHILSNKHVSCCSAMLIWSVIKKVVPMFSNEYIFHWFCISIFPILFLYFCSRNSYIPIYLKPKLLDALVYAKNRMAWQWAETLVEIRGTLADIRGTTKYGIRYHFPKHEFNRPVCLEAHHYLLAHLSQ